MRSPLLARPGAVDGVGVDAGVADHYGDPLREQRTLSEQGGVVDRSHRGVVRVAGADRLSWLHSLTSQHLSALPAGEWTQALVLSPHGHVEHHLTLHDDGEATWIHVEPGTAEALVGYLRSMQFMLRVDVDDMTDHRAIVTTVPPVGDVVDRVVHREALGAEIDRTGLPLVGHAAWESRRVAAGLPRLGFETDHRTIPHEVGWIGPAVHLDKGCYRGQETVARVHNLGRPPRRLVRFHLDGSVDTLPPPHTPVLLEDRSVGFLGTAVHHWEQGPIALAVVKRSVSDDAEFTVDGMAAKAERLVDA